MISLPSLRRHRVQLARRVTVLTLLIVTGAALSAAEPKKPSSATPVEVTNLVDVIGAVEVVGEPFKTPLTAHASVIVPAGSMNAFLTVELPAGKRAVIETISVSAGVPAGGRVYGMLQVVSPDGTGGPAIGLAFTEMGPYDPSTLFTSVTPATIRLHTDEHRIQFNLFRVGVPGHASFQATLFGYLEDL